MGSDWQITILVSTFQKHIFFLKKEARITLLSEKVNCLPETGHTNLCVCYTSKIMQVLNSWQDMYIFNKANFKTLSANDSAILQSE